jgi:endonuclease/exonuclease/phosphatase (EEP) superfamily protein YafD
MIQAGFKRSNGMGIGFTWPVQFPLFAMQIDHIFVRDVAVSDFKILGEIGSDHYPIQAALSVPNKF